ncbi:hypothetical protein ACFE04_017679 [Oxalis oulophora]
MANDDGLGLGLSLSIGRPQIQNPPPSLKLNLMSSSPTLVQQQNSKISWHELFHSDKTRQNTRSSFLRGFDVNVVPTGAVENCGGGGEDENGVSSPNSTVSSLSGKRSERELLIDDNDAERTSCSRGSEDEDGGGAGDEASRKKLRLSKEQALVLEETFKEHNTLNPKQKLALAKQLNLRARQVEVWFQNRRARTKLKQTEVDCEYLKRCCDNLTEENRRLQKEVQELRALKLSPQLYTQMNPPTTLTMCPSCERVSNSSSGNSTTRAALMNANQQRPMPINPWAALPIRQHRAPDSRP